jgi:hypothetical protein
MATDTRAVFLNLDQLIWSAFGGGGAGIDPVLFPFLWTIWFKADANGNEFFFTEGNHRDLGVADARPGAVISIDPSLGSLSTSVKPWQFGMQTLGMVGVVMVLMDDLGHVTAHGIQAGHEALNVGVADIVNNLVLTAIAQQAPPSQAQIDQAVIDARLSDKVSNAVQSAQTFCENVWALTGKDGEIGHVVQTWNVADFNDPSETKDVELKIIGGAGLIEWTVKGSITVTDQCPAKSLASTLTKALSTTASSATSPERQTAPDLATVLELMRDFRSRKSLLADTPFNEWWNAAKQHAPELAYRLATRRDAQELARPVIDSLVGHLTNDDKPISAQTISDCVRLLERIQEGATPRLQREVRTVQSLLVRLEHQTLHDALRIAATRRVAAERRPRNS